METLDAETAKISGEGDTYTRGLLNALLDMAHPAADASQLPIVAGDGYELEVDLAEIRECDECILSFRSPGGVRPAFPRFPCSTAVNGVARIQEQTSCSLTHTRARTRVLLRTCVR